MASERRSCVFCRQELTHSAFFRHLHDKTGRVCPAKQPSQLAEPKTDSETDDGFDWASQCSSNAHADSTFDFGTDSEGSDQEQSVDISTGDHHERFEADMREDRSTEESMDFNVMSDCSSSEGEEIWELSDSEPEDESVADSNETVEQILFGLTFFLSFFHIFYRVSERAMVSLLSFIKSVFALLGGILNNQLLLTVAQYLPKSLYGLHKSFKCEDGVKIFTVCPKCAQLYDIEDCVIRSPSGIESRKCLFVEFPNHPHRSHRSKCGAVLMKQVRLQGKPKFIPKKTYIYHSVIKALVDLAKRPDFLKKCEHWRERSARFSHGEMGDVYDGRLWNEMQYIEGLPFLAAPNNLCLAVNIDWFNPYDDSPYSVGAVYLVVLNLPRSERFKLQNVILAGMIPGPNEPVGDINSFLFPLVEDLQKLFRGISFQHSSSCLVTIRAMLLCLTCDLPATRKACGFSNFNALYGCSKCLKQFPTDDFGKKPDYSGYDWLNWSPRHAQMQKEKGTQFKKAETHSSRKEIAKSYGAKYSVLMELPAFDVVRCHVIDPMHAVFLGLAKHTTKTWKDIGIIGAKVYPVIQERVDLMVPPSKIGRIPRKIGAGFASFTADEWKHWILIYSLYALRELIPDVHYKCWSTFVLACRLLCLPIVTRTQINEAHILLADFCNTFERLYEKEACTPNMHMSLHLKECMLDFGPFSAFWCFPFERYNGILEGFKKSWCGPEKQMFTKFLGMQKAHFMESSSINNELIALVSKSNPMFKKSLENSTSFNLSQLQDSVTLGQVHNYTCAVAELDATEKPFYHLLQPLKEKCFSDAEYSSIKNMYSLLYPTTSVLHVSRFFHESKQIVINSEEFLSCSSRSKRSPAITACWPGVVGIDRYGEAPLRIGVALSFFRHEVTLVNGPDAASTTFHTIAKVKWYTDHPRGSTFHPLIKVCATTFDSESNSSFIPVSRIAGRVATAKSNVQFDYGEDIVLIAVPLLKTVLSLH